MTERFSLHALLPVLLFALVACGARPAAVREPEPEVVEPPAFSYAFAWTARADVSVFSDTGEIVVRNTFTRLNVLGVDTLGVRVRCLYCIPALEGTAAREDLVYEALPPDSAARLGLAEFALAVREAASQRDQDALSRVMSRDFTFSLDGGGGPLDAFNRWRFQGFRALDNLPPLLDRGLVTRDSTIWSAPPAFVTDVYYQGLRAGFRRGTQDRWEWIYLVGGDR